MLSWLEGNPVGRLAVGNVIPEPYPILVNERGIRGDAVVVAGVEVIVPLVGRAELHEVVAVKQLQVVAIVLIVAVPGALPRAGGVDVVRNEGIRRFAADFTARPAVPAVGVCRPPWTTTNSCECN